MARQNTESDPQATRQRLIEAGGEIFAQQGFRGTTVREICLRAEANVASINYHFGDKEHLYAEVLRHAHSSAVERHPYTSPAVGAKKPEEQLAFFIRAYLQRLFDQGRPAWHGRLLAREMSEPTRALNLLVDNSVRPQYETLTGIIAKLLPPGTPQASLELCARSIIGQCLYYHFARPVLERMKLNPFDDTQHLETLSAHILRFSLAALRQWKTPAQPLKK